MLTIITDSSSNLDMDEAEKLGVIVMPLTIIFGTREYRDGIDLSCDKFYEKLLSSAEFPHTSQLSEEQVEEAVKIALSRTDEVLILPISSALSGSYERCNRVAARHQGVYVYDTKCTSAMLLALVLKAAQNAQKTAEEVIKILDELRPKLRLYAAPNTLEYLHKGGRLSKFSALFGTVLKIKPVITIDQSGKVALLSKQFGMSQSLGYIAAKVKKANIDFSEPVYCLYTADEKNCNILIEKTGIKFTQKLNICPVIGTHIGPNGAGVVFAEK